MLVLLGRSAPFIDMGRNLPLAASLMDEGLVDAPNQIDLIHKPSVTITPSAWALALAPPEEILASKCASSNNVRIIPTNFSIKISLFRI